MKFSIKVIEPEKAKVSCLVLGVFEDRQMFNSASRIDKHTKGYLSGLFKSGDFQGKLGTTQILFDVSGIAASRTLLVGLGKKDTFGAKEYCEAVKSSVSALSLTGAGDALFYLTDFVLKGCDAEWKARHFVMAASEALYRFDATKSKKHPDRMLRSIVIGLQSASEKAQYEQGLTTGGAISRGMDLAKELSNLPGNICTPTHLAQSAKNISAELGLKVEILERRDMERMKMGALLSVAKGSRQPPKFIVMRHDGAGKKDRPIVLIGKGITFDTGGISIKPSAEMDEMKFDMCGAAAVIGVMRAVSEMKLKLNVVGIVPSTENMPGGAASKPGDIVTTMSGQTVEILNTDAEGRLILCDALTYAERFSPAAVIDIATLTGACVIALGHVCAGLFSNSDKLSQELLDAGQLSWDRAWRMPIWDDYQDQLKSNFADFANIGGRAAGSITAACFLSRFAKKFDWAHLDIAGIAWKSGKDKGATGRPIPLITSFLIDKQAQVTQGR